MSAVDRVSNLSKAFARLKDLAEDRASWSIYGNGQGKFFVSLRGSERYSYELEGKGDTLEAAILDVVEKLRDETSKALASEVYKSTRLDRLANLLKDLS